MGSRKRIISPQFFTHEALFDAESRSSLPLRVAFAGLWTQADRRGVFEWRPRQLKLAVLPYDQVDFDAVLCALQGAGFVASFEDDDGRRYGYIPSFTRWQTFHHREESKLPVPPNWTAHDQPQARLGPAQEEPRSSPTASAAASASESASASAFSSSISFADDDPLTTDHDQSSASPSDQQSVKPWREALRVISEERRRVETQ